MQFIWYGQSCFRIEGEQAIVVTDPFGKDYGLRLPRWTADIVTVSHAHGDHNNIEAVKGTETTQQPFVITDPGEYETRGCFIYGIPAFHDESKGSERGRNIIYRIEMDGVSITHLGDLGHELEPEQLERLEGTDILLLPVGGVYAIDGKTATKVVNQIEPRVIIPMHYKIPGLKTSKPLEGLDAFCKEIGICPAESLTKYKIAKKDLPQEDMQVVLMSP